MPLFLFLKYLIDSHENAALLDVAELVVDSRTKHPHRRRQPHIGMDKRRNSIAMSSHMSIEYAEVALEIATVEELTERFLIGIGLERCDRPYKLVGIGEIFVEEEEYHVAADRCIARIHSHLAEEIADIRVDDRQRAKTVPKVIEHIDGFCTGARALVFRTHERTPQLKSVWQIIFEKTLREPEHMARRNHRVTLIVEAYVAAAYISVASEYKLALRIPHYQLTARLAVDIAFESRAATGRTECNLAQTADFAHGVGRIMGGHDIYLITTLIGRAEEFIASEFGFDKRSLYWVYYRFIHC